MSDQQVTYELNLKDGLSPKVEGATGHVNKLEHSMHSLGERITHVAEAFGISFAIFKGMQFVEEGIESMEKLHQAEAQLQNTMENMGTYTAEAFEKMVAGAGDLAKNVKFSRAEVIELQSQLGLVGNIGEGEMNRLTKVSADLATKMGTGLTEAGNLLAKAINAPEMARRLGMALKIDPGVMQHVMNLAKHGHEAQARMELLAIAESKVGGAAEAAFNADPLARFNKTMASIKNDVGGLAIDFLKVLTPALEWVADAFKNASVWVKEHKDLLKAIAIGVATAASVYYGYLLVTNAVSIATRIWTAIQWALNAALDANPIGIIVLAIAALVTAVVYAYNHFAKFRAVLWGVWEFIKAFANWIVVAPIKIFYELGEAVLNIFHPAKMIEHLQAAKAVVFDGAKDLATSFKKGYDEGMADFAADQAKEKESLIPKKIGKLQKFQSDKIAEPKTKATGSKSVTINVSIKDLIGVQNINTTNLKEGAGKIKDMVVQILSGAVNDFQIVADH